MREGVCGGEGGTPDNMYIIAASSKQTVSGDQIFII